MTILNWLIGAGGWILLTATMLAQGPSDAAAALEAARIAAEIEGDAATAIELYGRVSGDASAPVDLREHADFEAALLARRLGRADEAAAMLEELAGGETRWARRAQDVLAGRAPEDPRIAARVHRAIDKLHDESTEKEGSADLQLIGAPAAPYVAEAIRGDRGDLSFTSRAVSVLTAIGGRAAEDFFRSVVESDDVIYRRTVARAMKGLTGAASTNAKRDPLLPEVRKFLRDADARVRTSVMQFLAGGLNAVSVEEGIALLGDADAHVRARFSVYVNWMSNLDESTVGTAVDAIVAGARGLETSERSRMMRLLARPVVLRTEVGLDRFLDELESNEDLATDGYVWSQWQLSRVRDMPAAARPTPAELAARVPRLAKQIAGAFRPAPSRDHRGEGFLRVIDALVEKWGRDDLDGLFQLHRALEPYAVDDDLEERMVALLEPSDLPRVLESLETFRYTRHVARWLQDQGPGPELAAALRRWLANRIEDAEPDRNPKWQGMTQMVSLAARIPDQGLQDELLKIIEKKPIYFEFVVRGLVEIGATGPGVSAIATTEVPGSIVPAFRALLVEQLLRAGDPSAAKTGAYARAFELGVVASPNTNPRREMPPFEEWGYGADETARILDAILATGKPSAWENYEPRRGSRVPDTLRPVFARRLLDAPAEALPRAVRDLMPTLAASADPELIAVFDRIVSHPSSEVRHAAVSALISVANPRGDAAILAALDDPVRQVVLAAAHAAGRRHLEAAEEKLTALLAAQPGRDIINAVAELKGDDAILLLAPLLADPSPSVRLSVCKALGRMETHAAAEPLVRALRDNESSVREQAQKSLEELQFFLDQKARWEKWSRGVGLDQPSAAAALVEQAQGGKKAVRLAAIESLGTLGEATTLPFLIKLMGSGDADVAAAAKAAVDRINGK